MIEVNELSKQYGDKRVVDALTFEVRPGSVTGFLGPNGAGKSTTMRMILGLTAATSGTARVNGKCYRTHRAPMREIGALIDVAPVGTGRSAYHHLLAFAATHGFSRRRVREVLDTVGLADVADKRASAFSLGMGQRLGIAAALLGDPATIMLDEPVNGLDPEGVLWIRNLLRNLAAEGRTVFLSSHLMAEMAVTAERLIIVGRGRLVADVTVAELTEAAVKTVRVRTAHARRLAELLTRTDAVVVADGRDQLGVRGMSAADVGAHAARAGIALQELTPERASLEDAFMELTRDAVEYHAAVGEEAPHGLRRTQTVELSPSG